LRLPRRPLHCGLRPRGQEPGGVHRGLRGAGGLAGPLRAAASLRRGYVPARPLRPHSYRNDRDHAEMSDARGTSFQPAAAGSLPPCGGGPGRGVEKRVDVAGVPPSLTLPHKGGGNRPSPWRRLRITPAATALVVLMTILGGVWWIDSLG